MKTHLLPLLIILGTLSACKEDLPKAFDSSTPLDEDPHLISPVQGALDAGYEFKQRFPEARIYFSQRSGEVLWIDSNGGVPLSSGSVSNADDALKVVKEFIAQNSGLFPMGNEFSLAVHGDGFIKSGKMISLRFDQLRNGLAFLGHYGLAQFSLDGKLISLYSRLSNTSDVQVPDVIMAQAQAKGLSSDWVIEEEGNQNIGRIFRGKLKNRLGRRAKKIKRYSWARPLKGQTQVVEETIERSDERVFRIFKNPLTGEVLETRDETKADFVSAPSKWYNNAVNTWRAYDMLNNAQEIPSIMAGSTLVLGFRSKEIFDNGKFAYIVDNNHTTKGSNQVLATNAGGWDREVDYEGYKRAATMLAKNIDLTLKWYLSRGRRSWDGEGGSVKGAINGRINSSEPESYEFNAWGGNGFITIGDGVTFGLQSLSEALDVVGHEFTHSVIDATADFTYSGESGALNESLADIFGKSIEGFQTTRIGYSLGISLRDIVNPAGCYGCTQPDSYSKYEFRSNDNGGVHYNSGIMNKALSAVVVDSSKPASVAANELTTIILGALNDIPFSPSTKLEEFAAIITGYCKMSAPDLELCDSLEKSFLESELLGAQI